MTDTTTGPIAILPLRQNIGLRDSVAERLLVAILDGTVRAGNRLVGQRLAAQLGVSATPVREALIELATLGFVKLLPNRGAVCCKFGPTELRDIFQVRRILEAEATFSVCGHMPAEPLRELCGRMLKLSKTVETDPAWSEQAMAADHALHQAILQHCPNRRLAHEIERYNVLMRAIRRVVGNLYNVQLRAVSEHLQILKALLAEDDDLARKRMSKHIESTARGIVKVMFQPHGG